MNTETNAVSLAERGQATAGLLIVVAEMRAVRDRASARAGRPVSFKEAATGITRYAANKETEEFLNDLAELLEQHDAETIDAELDRFWRDALNKRA